MENINYRKGGPAVRAAWFAFKAARPHDATSVPAFVAGWNAAHAMAEINEQERAKEKHKANFEHDEGCCCDICGNNGYGAVTP